MSRHRLTPPIVFLATLPVTGCAAVVDYWAYAGPHLSESEEAIYRTWEGSYLMSLDGEPPDSLCVGKGKEERGYPGYKEVYCHIHIRPGLHTVVHRFRPDPSYDIWRTDSHSFTALPGKAYALLCVDSEMVSPGVFRCRRTVAEVEILSAGEIRHVRSGSGG